MCDLWCVSSIVTYVILNDVHFPYEDRSRYKVAINIFKSLNNLAGIYLNGDIGEFQGVSAWPTHPTEKGMGFVKELDYMNKKFDEMQSDFQGIPVTYLCGNHENRFFRYVRDIAPAMWGVIDCPQLLKFPERPHWKFVDYGPSQIERCGKSNLYLRHEPLGGGGNPAKLTAEKSYIDIATGHVHKYCTYSHKKFGVKPIINTAYCLGYLGDKSRHVFDYRGSKDEWVVGCTVVECEVKTGQYTLEFINLEKIPTFYRGRMFDAK